MSQFLVNGLVFKGTDILEVGSIVPLLCDCTVNTHSLKHLN